MELKEIRLEGVAWMTLAHNEVQWEARDYSNKSPSSIQVKVLSLCLIKNNIMNKYEELEV